AREDESSQNTGIEYRVADASTLPMLDRFDLATAMYLLHYAETPEEMACMSRSIAANLVHGGHLVALLPDPDYVVDKGDTARYSFGSRAIASGEGWILVHLDIHTTPSLSIEYRQWTRRIY